jgi:hypothetical protein
MWVDQEIYLEKHETNCTTPRKTTKVATLRKTKHQNIYEPVEFIADRGRHQIRESRQTRIQLDSGLGSNNDSDISKAYVDLMGTIEPLDRIRRDTWYSCP